MLLELTIQNFALIDHLRFSLGEGLNVLTGETGAGKSIIIDAMGLLLGGRASADYIREGEEKALIEGVFLGPPEEGVLRLLEEQGISWAPEEPLILSREISRSGRNLCRINGRVTTLSLYREVGQRLVDLHGQQEQQLLLNPEWQLKLLDSYAGREVEELREEVRRLAQELRRIRNELRQWEERERDCAHRWDLLSFQVEEISKARLSPGEEEQLLQERSVLQNAEKIIQGLSRAYQLLFVGSSSSLSARDQLGKALGELRILTAMVPELQRLKETVEEATVMVEEAARELAAYRERIEADPRRLEEVEERLALIRQLQRKYGSSIEEILRYREKAQEELEQLSQRDKTIASLAERKRQQEEAYRQRAEELSRRRREAACQLEEAVAEELRYLNMPEVKFSVGFSRREEDSLGGLDGIEFLISPNPGEPLKPLSRIASGGEMSRIMLALKNILARVDRVPTLIFDEIDTGIGGRALEAVASRLEKIARSFQVICVTHAPQIASRADCHWYIEKEVKEGRTYTRLKALTEEERVQELARMLAGDAVSEVTIKHAQEMLRQARRRRV